MIADKDFLEAHPGPQKIAPVHLQRLAVVYVRQSTPQQVFDHQESTACNTPWSTAPGSLGWPEERILVIDDDLGNTGRRGCARPGFQRLLAEVSLDHVGMILGLEMCRLARS